jgi:hypothetical protein
MLDHHKTPSEFRCFSPRSPRPFFSGIPLLVFTWLLLVLDDPEQNFPAIDEQQGD